MSSLSVGTLVTGQQSIIVTPLETVCISTLHRNLSKFSIQKEGIIYCFCLFTALLTAFTIRQMMIVITISSSVFPTGVSTCIRIR